MAKLPPHVTSRIRSTPSPHQIDLPAYYDHLTRGDRVRVRERYEDEQQGKCCHCGEPLSGDPPSSITSVPIRWHLFPGGREGFLRNRVHLHHSHDTGLTIGAVHAHCNAWLWQYRKE